MTHDGPGRRVACLVGATLMSVVTFAPIRAQTDAERIANAVDVRELMASAEYLTDVIGPRLTGSDGYSRAVAWLHRWYAAHGIRVETESYGTADRWTRGPSELTLLEPRVRRLEGMASAGALPTDGHVEGEVLALPRFESPEAFHEWLADVRGAFVLLMWDEPTCRTREDWEASARPSERGLWASRHDSAQSAWQANLERAGTNWEGLVQAIESAEGAGVILSQWSRGWGTFRVHRSPSATVPSFHLSCEDYGLLARLAREGHDPVIEAVNEPRTGPPDSVANVIAEIPGRARPEEYVILSAHLDSWDAASGATDNAAGTLAVMEAMRILSKVDPAPRRTILAGHWGGEEQGLLGSRAFVAAHPDMQNAIQVVLNSDLGTGRVTRISMQGFLDAAPVVRRWLAASSSDLAERGIVDPGAPGDGGESDHVPFLCRGVPAFYLESERWGYGAYTWHSNRDTFDKLVASDLEDMAVLLATLAFEASEDPERIPRDRTELPSEARAAACAEDAG